MVRLFLAVFAIVLTTLSISAPLGAQSLGSLLPGQAKTETEIVSETLSETLRNAANNGVSVVVIDPDGKVLGQTEAAPHTEDGLPNVDGTSLMEEQERADRFRSALTEHLMELPAAFNEVQFILRAASPDGTIIAFFNALGLSLLMFAAGALFERKIFAQRIASRWLAPRIKENPQGYSEKMPLLLFRFGLGVVGILVSIAVAYILGAIIFGPIEDTAMRFTVTLINVGYFSCRLAAALWRMILSPFLSQYRIPSLTDREAKRLHLWLWSLASIDIVFILFGIWIGELGLNYDVYAFISSMMSATIVLLNILMVLVNHKAISSALRADKPYAECSLMIRMLVRLWAPVVILYVLFAWAELTYDLVLQNPSSVPLIAGAYGILISIIVVYGVISYAIERWFARARAIRLLKEQRRELEALEQARAEMEALALRQRQEDGPDEDDIKDAALVVMDPETGSAPALPAVAADEVITKASTAIDIGGDGEPAQDDVSALQHDILVAQHTLEDQGLTPRGALNSFEALARRVAGILAFVAGIYAFFYIWDNDSARMVESYADRVLDIMAILFVGYIVYHAFRIWIDNKIADETADDVEGELGGEGGGTGASRLATLLPLFRNFMLIVVVVTLALIILMEIGINVSPLFAGAGIVGIAVGFGSQALVRDIFAGAFFLFDDAFRKGEYLDVGGVKGTVEKISVRSFQLRHHLGALHTIPFGELQVMTNYSRDWVIMKLPLRVTYDTDVEVVRKMIKQLGVELLDDPVIGNNFIQPLKSQGVIEMQDSAMIIRVKFMTKPGDQWLVRKKVYEEIRELFERNGIRFAHREVTVRLADGKVEDLNEEQKKEVAAAAHASMEEELMDDTEGDDR
ncbi:mechanosensitive ion channel protein MscS [Sulfitobacter sp. SK012]|uniref:mechanosensitive ion channel family protein n=1 Tax=Sulfitobacter sp. SK012 TaxID=1389005 RepID=UPI000E0B1D16|nr:mechanosensitive ion channel family protein [Sulfitobacter sp. SK012]AXI48038.1 mechanosensitive ion channel protein MscS [Sulfitobacter sp. SK012]